MNVFMLITNDDSSGLRGALFATEADALSSLRDNYASGEDVSDADLMAHVESQGVECSLTEETIPGAERPTNA